MSKDSPPVTIGGLLRWAHHEFKACETAILDARVLMKHASGLGDGDLIAREPSVLPAQKRDNFLELVARRKTGEPVAYLTGRKEFWGLAFSVSPDVLIPRGDSEALIEAGLSRRSQTSRILDLGTGTGCLVAAFLSEFTTAFGIGVDRCPRAASMARCNLRRLGFAERSAIVVADWADALCTIESPFDVIVSNPPYIPFSDRPRLPPDVRDHEPACALYSGQNGLADTEKVFRAAQRLLCDDGLLIVEAGDHAIGSLQNMAARFFPTARASVQPDLTGTPRAIVIDRADVKRS